MVKWDFVVTKPIFMILHGHSVKELVNRWNDFKDLDVHWFSMNHCAYLGKFMKFPLDVYIWYCTHKQCNRHNTKHTFSESLKRGNSPIEFVLQCVENNAKEVVFFGMDGYSPSKEITYFDGTYDFCAHNAHAKECAHFNSRIPKDTATKFYNVVSKDIPSNYKGMIEIGYDDVLAYFPNKKQNTQTDELPQQHIQENV